MILVPPPPGADEPRLPNETAIAYVRRTAYNKATQALAHLSPGAPPTEQAILCADTTVELDGDILGKPANMTDAARMLHALSDKSHHVHTAIVLAVEGRYYQALSTSKVSFKRLSNQEITAYCASGEPFGKAGAYGIQGRAGAFVRNLEGSYSGVMGLPLYETCQLLSQANLLQSSD